MKKSYKCYICCKTLDKIAIGLSKKLLGENGRLYCVECLANYLDTTEDELLIKAEEFKNEGCTLFQ